MGCSATTAYKITGTLGKNSKPKLPDAVTTPSEKFSGYPSARKIGYTSPPNARMVTPDPPVNVVNTAQTKMTMSANPAGNQPTSALNKRTKRCDEPPTAST